MTDADVSFCKWAANYLLHGLKTARDNTPEQRAHNTLRSIRTRAKYVTGATQRQVVATRNAHDA